MDWKKTSIKLTLNNEKNYKKGFIVRTFNNIVSEPTPEQLHLLAEAIEMISDGDTFAKAEIMVKDEYAG